jgi:hypothetical protein
LRYFFSVFTFYGALNSLIHHAYVIAVTRLCYFPKIMASASRHKDTQCNDGFLNRVEEWDVWPRGPRLQGEDAGKAGARGEQQNNRTTEQQNINKTKEYHRHTSKQDIEISVKLDGGVAHR